MSIQTERPEVRDVEANPFPLRVEEGSLRKLATAAFRYGPSVAVVNMAYDYGSETDAVIFDETAVTRRFAIGISSKAVKHFMAEERAGRCPYDRDQTIWSDLSQKLFVSHGEDRPPISHLPAFVNGERNPDQLSTNVELRKRFNRLDAEELASRSFEQVMAAQEAADGCVTDALRLSIIAPVAAELSGLSGLTTEEFIQYSDSARLRLIFTVIQHLVKGRHAEKLIGKVVERSDKGKGIDFESKMREAANDDPLLTNADVTSIFAANQAIVSSAYWVFDGLMTMDPEQRQLYSDQDCALEAMRIGGVFLTVPPKVTSEPGLEDTTVLLSMAAAAKDLVTRQEQNIYDPARYAVDPELRARLFGYVFGRQSHSCPSALFTRRYLESLAAQAKASPSTFTPGRTDKPEKLKLNTLLIKPRYQARLVA